jgi:hypothetical protein
MRFWKRFFTSLFAPVDFKLVLILMGLYFLFLGIRAMWLYIQDPYTEKVTGRVILAKAESNDDIDHPRTIYSFRYEYTFQGKTYTSDRYHYKTEDGHYEAVSQFQTGDQIEVFIRPEDPTQAIVKKGWSWLNLLWMVLSLLILYKVLRMHYLMLKQE